MSPDIEFKNDITGYCLEGNTKCAVKVRNVDEKGSEGSFGAFVPKDRPNLAQEVETLKREMANMKLEMCLLQKHTKISDMYNLANLTVQFTYELEKDTIILFIVDDAAKTEKCNSQI